MLIGNNFTASATLTGNESTFSVTIEIEDISLLKGDIEGKEGDVIESVRVTTLLQFVSDTINLSQPGSLSIWADSMYDLMDLSLCMAHFAGRDDTTSEIADIEPNSSYSHRAQWVLIKELFDCDLLMYAKNTPRFTGKRFVDILFFLESKEPEQCRIAHLEASPDTIQRFAEELYQMHNAVQELMSNPNC